MERKTFIYWAAPCFTLLSCIPSLQGLMGAQPCLIVACALGLVAWGLVWMRLFGQERLRPEFAVLSIVPFMVQALYLYLGTGPGSAMAEMSGPAFQNLYFAFWALGAWVAVMALRRAPHELKGADKDAPDMMFRIMCPVSIAFYLLCWVSSVPRIFPSYDL